MVKIEEQYGAIEASSSQIVLLKPVGATQGVQSADWRVEPTIARVAHLQQIANSHQEPFFRTL